jgi:hypothetical protein
MSQVSFGPRVGGYVRRTALSLARLSAGSLLLTMILACGGGPPGATQSSGATQPPGATATPATQPTPGAGESIDSEGVSAALAALESLDSWTFDVKTWTKSVDETREQDVRGTERRKPGLAIDANHTSPSGDFHYIRIGDDIWTNLGTDLFYHYDAADSENLISQYEPLYVNGLVETVAAFTNVDYEPVGSETVNGFPAVHYRSTEADRENLAQSYAGLTPDQWAADVWLAVDRGYLVRLAWGPQSVETAQASMGFLYDTTSTNCDCPINPPTNVASP